MTFEVMFKSGDRIALRDDPKTRGTFVRIGRQVGSGSC